MSEKFDNLIRQDKPEDPKRYAVVRSTQALIGGFILMCSAACYQIIKHLDIGDNTVKAILGLAFLVAALAGVSHAKPDTNIDFAPKG